MNEIFSLIDENRSSRLFKVFAFFNESFNCPLTDISEAVLQSLIFLPISSCYSENQTQHYPKKGYRESLDLSVTNCILSKGELANILLIYRISIDFWGKASRRVPKKKISVPLENSCWGRYRRFLKNIKKTLVEYFYPKRLSRYPVH
jgi:hypothetical protein